MFTNLKELIQSMPSEDVCREYLAKQRWENGKAVCPYCDCGKCYTVYNGKKYKCSKCRKIFSVIVGTIFEASNIPLS
jgi:transposase-like protein